MFNTCYLDDLEDYSDELIKLFKAGYNINESLNIISEIKKKKEEHKNEIDKFIKDKDAL